MRNKPKRTIRIIHNLARSGGTLIGKTLACMQNNALLSEIHPDAQHALSFNAIKQAQNWFDLDPNLHWQQIPFLEGIKKIQQHCDKQEKKLILRDWSHIDYFGFPVTNNPSQKDELTQLLTPHFEIKTVQIIRDPIDTWESFSRLNIVKESKLSISKFINGYINYLHQTQSDFQLSYEEFLKNPNDQLKMTCEALDCKFDPNYKDNWFEFSNITGDQSSQSSLRKTSTIRPRPKKVINNEIKEKFMLDVKYQKLMKLLPQYDVIKC